MTVIDRFGSLASWGEKARATAARFPYTLASAVIGAATVMRLIYLDLPNPPAVLWKLALVCALGLPLFTALSTYAERITWPAAVRQAFPAVGILVLALYYISLPDQLVDTTQHLVRSLLLAAGLHFLAAFIAYARPGETNGFWQYNKTLFVRFVQTGVFSAVLFGGLAIAIASINHLFDAGIDEKVYAYLWVLMAGVFQTWVFLAGIPTRDEALREKHEYPPALKVFAQSILMTLVIVYFAILIVYELKIVVTWNWPKGWVAQLVLWYSVVGILASLLLHPLRDDPQHRWIQWFDRWFFRGLVPLAAMLFIAIYIRIADYGITVPRYLVLGMAAGLAVVVLYFLFSHKRDIRVIPIVLCVLAFVSAFGPQSAFSVAKRSQQNRLGEYLSKHGLFVDAQFHDPAEDIPLNDQMEMSSIVSYLHEWHGLRSFEPWIEDSVIAKWESISDSAYIPHNSICEYMRFGYVAPWERLDFQDDSGVTQISFSVGLMDVPSLPTLAISGYDYLLECHVFTESDSTLYYAMGSDSCTVTFYPDSGMISLRTTQPTPADTEVVAISVVDMIESLEFGRDFVALDMDRAIVERSGDAYDYRFILRSCSGSKSSKGYRFSEVDGWLLVRRKR